jgi:hypothetical protein
MRPDRIVVGECRGGEALDMLQAMNTGHDGSLTTLHSNSPRDTLARSRPGADGRLRPAGAGHPRADGLGRRPHRAPHPPADGTRRITHITEVEGMEGDVITLQDIFLFDFGMGVDEHGKFKGHLKATGIRPKFSEKLADQGIKLPADLFEPEPFARRGGHRHSGSMQGAADRGGQGGRPVFVAQKRAEDFVALVTFSDEAEVLSNFTTSRGTLNQQIDGIEAAGETAMYDGIIRATELFAGSTDQIRKNMIVLTDGADTSSSANAGEAIARSRRGRPDVRRGARVGRLRPGPAAADHRGRRVLPDHPRPRAAHQPVRPDPAGTGQHPGGAVQLRDLQPGRDRTGCPVRPAAGPRTFQSARVPHHHPTIPAGPTTTTTLPMAEPRSWSSLRCRSTPT